MKIRTTHAYLNLYRWLVFAVRVTNNEHNLSIIGTFVEHNRKIFGAVQHSMIGIFWCIIGSALATMERERLKPISPVKCMGTVLVLQIVT